MGRVYERIDERQAGGAFPGCDQKREDEERQPAALRGGHGEHRFNDEAHIAGRTGILSGSGSEQDFRALLWNGASYVDIGAAQPQSMANAVNNSDWAVGRAGVFLGTLPLVPALVRRTAPAACGGATR